MTITDILMYAAIAVMVFMMFRSSRKRKQQAAELQQQLVPGAKVMLHSGIIGRVVSVSDTNIVLNSAGSDLEVVRQAIRTVSAWDAEPAADDADASASEKTEN